MRHTSSHTRNRRSHHALTGERVSKDTESGTVHPRHKALLDGTTYRGRSVMDLTSKKTSAKKGAVRDTKKKDDKVEMVDEHLTKDVAASKKPIEKKIKK